MKTRLGDAMIEAMSPNISWVMWGDAYLLDAAYYAVHSRPHAIPHPLNRWQRVLNALDRDERFEKSYCRLDLWIGECYRKRLVRSFKLKEADRY